MRRVGWMVACAVLLSGCAGPGKREATKLTTAVDAYRRAPNPAKAERARAVADVACTDAKVCDAKASCVAAVEPTTRALALKDEVAARVADIEKGALAPNSPEAAALPGKLDEAERLLGQGRTAMADCDRKLLELMTTFGG